MENPERNAQTAPKSVFEPFIKLFYDSNKGGLQLGGAIGSLLGAAAGFYMTGGGTGGWTGIIPIVLLAGAGAWGGKKAAEKLAEPSVPTTPMSSTENEKTIPARVQEKTAEIASDLLHKGEDLGEKALAAAGNVKDQIVQTASHFTGHGLSTTKQPEENTGKTVP